MGKIVAMGGGFDRGGDEYEMMEYIIGLSGKEKPNYLQIPTAGFDGVDGGSVSRWSKWGCDTDVLYLTHAYMTEEIVARQIRRADVIYVPGGDLQFLMKTWNRTNAAFYLKEAFEQGKVLFGFSSGSMCWFKQGFDDCGPKGSFMFVDALGLIPYCNVPHYEGGYWQEFNAFADKTPLSTVCLENNTALCYIDGKYSVKVAGDRPDARAWFIDANDGYKRYNLIEHPEILERM